FRKQDAAGPPRAVDPAREASLQSLLTIADRCNHAQVLPAGNGKAGWKVVGDPTEGALRVLAMKAKIRHLPTADGAAGASPGVHDPDVLHELPFASERKAMSIVVADPAGGAVMYTKGAPEVVLGMCPAEFRDGAVVPLNENRRREITGAAAEMASRALRVLAFASRKWKTTDG